MTLNTRMFVRGLEEMFGRVCMCLGVYERASECTNNHE